METEPLSSNSSNLLELKHVGFIMDGNGRWAKERGKKRTFGHQEGVKRIYEIVDVALEQKIKALTFYAFSTENWNRPQDEINYIMKLLKRFIVNNEKDLLKKGIKFNYIGNLEDKRINSNLVKLFKDLKEKTKDNENLILTIAFNYGFKEELTNAVKRMVKEEKDLENITIEDIEKRLYSAGLPELDLIIRTSGELRLSNFMLLQAAYSELYFTNTYWPDFKKDDFLKAIENYHHRKRRYGGI